MRFRVLFFIISISCCVASGAYAATAVSAVSSVAGEAVIEADSLVGQKDRQLEATGDATLRKDGKLIRADKLLYLPNTREVDAEGAVVLEQVQGDKVSGPHLHMDMESGLGKMEQPQFQFQGAFGRADADTMEVQDKQHYSLSNAMYTTCPAGNDDWRLNMGSLQLDRAEQIGTARDASVEFMGVPFIYTPWMDFPLDDHRTSGFLSPTYGATSNSGLDFSLPYYWNIAPNMDATIIPRVMTKRGEQLNNEFRYMGAGYAGELHADVLANDRIANLSREHYSAKYSESIVTGVIGNIDYNHVTDDAYYRDGLGAPGLVNSASQVNLMQQAWISANADGWNSTVRVQRFQTLQDPLAPIVAPYARLPQITTTTSQSVSDFNVAFTGDYTDFSHPALVSGTRLVLNPSVSYPLVNDPSFYVTPKLTLNSTQYVMGANNNAAGLANMGLTNVTMLPNASRNMPLFSLDSGMFFDRDAKVLGNDYIQTLEPRAYYVYVPYRNQNTLPNFDSALADFNMTTMFTENRFAGYDRIGDADQITLATTTRLLAQDNGAERLRVMLGERFSFITPQVNLATPAATTGKSDILLGVGGGAGKTLYFDSLIDYDPNQSRTQQYSWTMRYRPEPGKTLNLGYQFQSNVTQQVDFSEQWPISQRWGTVAKMNYSFLDKRIVNSIAGVEYNEACWTLRFVAQYTTTATLQATTGLFLVLDLNNFMQAGVDPTATLKQYIPGYTKTNTSPATPPAAGNP